jgi:hypothetical protein
LAAAGVTSGTDPAATEHGYGRGVTNADGSSGDDGEQAKQTADQRRQEAATRAAQRHNFGDCIEGSVVHWTMMHRSARRHTGESTGFFEQFFGY